MMQTKAATWSAQEYFAVLSFVKRRLREPTSAWKQRPIRTPRKLGHRLLDSNDIKTQILWYFIDSYGDDPGACMAHLMRYFAINEFIRDHAEALSDLGHLAHTPTGSYPSWALVCLLAILPSPRSSSAADGKFDWDAVSLLLHDPSEMADVLDWRLGKPELAETISW